MVASRVQPIGIAARPASEERQAVSASPPRRRNQGIARAAAAVSATRRSCSQPSAADRSLRTPSIGLSSASASVLAYPSRFTATCCATAAATRWPMRGMIRGRSRIGSAIGQFSIPCAIPNWHRRGLRTFGAELNVNSTRPQIVNDPLASGFGRLPVGRFGRPIVGWLARELYALCSVPMSVWPLQQKLPIPASDFFAAGERLIPPWHRNRWDGGNPAAIHGRPSRRRRAPHLGRVHR